MYVCICVFLVLSETGGQKKVLGSRELQLWIAVSHHVGAVLATMWVLRIEPGALERQQCSYTVSHLSIPRKKHIFRRGRDRGQM